MRPVPLQNLLITFLPGESEILESNIEVSFSKAWESSIA